MTAKLTITVGLPASGKSTWADAQRSIASDFTRVVTRDDLRVAISAQFEFGDEPIVVAMRDYAIRRLLERGYHVICADTNLDSKTQRNMRAMADSVGAEFAIQDFRHVPLETCLTRNDYRHAQGDDKVPNEAIRSMYDRFIKSSSN